MCEPAGRREDLKQNRKERQEKRLKMKLHSFACLALFACLAWWTEKGDDGRQEGRTRKGTKKSGKERGGHLRCVSSISSVDWLLCRLAAPHYHLNLLSRLPLHACTASSHLPQLLQHCLPASSLLTFITALYFSLPFLLPALPCTFCPCLARSVSRFTARAHFLFLHTQSP